MGISLKLHTGISARFLQRHFTNTSQITKKPTEAYNAISWKRHRSLLTNVKKRIIIYRKSHLVSIFKRESTLKITRENNYYGVMAWEEVWVRRLVNRDVISVLWTHLTSADHFYPRVKCQEGMTRALFLSWLSHSLCLRYIRKKSHNKKKCLCSFSIHKFPSRDFVRINFRIYFRGENLFTYLWKLLLCDCIFHSKWVAIKWKRHDYASFTIWTNIVSSLLRLSNLFTSHLNGLITHVLGGIFL